MRLQTSLVIEIDSSTRDREIQMIAPQTIVVKTYTIFAVDTLLLLPTPSSLLLGMTTTTVVELTTLKALEASS